MTQNSIFSTFSGRIELAVTGHVFCSNLKRAIHFVPEDFAKNMPNMENERVTSDVSETEEMTKVENTKDGFADAMSKVLAQSIGEVSKNNKHK